MLDLFGNIFVATCSSNSNEELFTDCLYSFNNLNLLKLWQSSNKSNFWSNISLFLIRDGADDQSKQSHELPAAEEDSAAAGTAKSGQPAGRWIQTFHFMSDTVNASRCHSFFFHPKKAKHTLVVSFNSSALFLLSSMGKKTELEAAQWEYRLGLVKIKHLPAANAHKRLCWSCVAAVIG